MKLLPLITFLLISHFLLAQSFIQSMKKLPGTGQTTSYTSTFGEDDDYSINAPVYKNNGNGTITDTITTLMWQQKDGGEMTIENAKIYCDTLTLGGYTDWRMPSAMESFSILNHQNNNPAIDTTYFTTTTAEYWWSSQSQNNDAAKIWVTNSGGGIGNHPKSETISAGGSKRFHIRALRDVTTPITIPSRFTDNGDNTITDNFSNLVWQKTPSTSTFTWEQAITNAESLSLAGQTDWRLPNIKDLQSLTDVSVNTPSVAAPHFAAMGSKKYWSSTSLPNQTTRAWYLSTQYGVTTYDEKTVPNNVICVRGGGKKTSSLQSPFTNKIEVDLFIDRNTETIQIQSENIREICKIHILNLNPNYALGFDQRKRLRC